MDPKKLRDLRKAIAASAESRQPMGAETGIAWTDHTFNPWWGCTRVSPGCENCYAEAWDARWSSIFTAGGDKKAEHWGVQAPRRFFGDAHWNEPVRWNKSAAKRQVRERVFCASMADVFEDRRDLDEQRVRLWRLIEDTPWLDWQLLTKRPQNILPLAPAAWVLPSSGPVGRGWPTNVWIGTTVEDQQRADERIPHLLRVPAAVRFLSCEPLLGPVDLRSYLFDSLPLLTKKNLKQQKNPFLIDTTVINERAIIASGNLHWVIVGGESGHGARAMRLEWARSLVSQCKAAGVATFVKQLGAKPAEERRCDTPACNCGATHLVPLTLDSNKGGDVAEWPADLRVREFPAATRTTPKGESDAEG